MILNKFEFVSMNNPVRALVQEYIEIKELRKLSQLPSGKKILEIGCGNGWGTKLIKKYFSPIEIQAIDLDPKMINIAKANNNDSKTVFVLGDATKLLYKDDYFDAIFDFGIIHHIPNWKTCLDELKRVLKPGGQLLIEDLSTETFATPFGRLLKKILDHPYSSMYKRSEFLEYLKSIGFKVSKYRFYYPLSSIQYFVVIANK